ncbi:MAG: flavin reductase family protein, partial [Alphaproteobacteria bacterium]
PSAFLFPGLPEHPPHLTNPAPAPPPRPWADLPTRTGKTGAPLLADCVAWIECEMEAIHPGGDHDIFVGRAVALEAAAAARPLLYFGGGYRRLDPDEVR